MLEVETALAPSAAYQRAILPLARSGPPALKSSCAVHSCSWLFCSVQSAPRLLSPYGGVSITLSDKSCGTWPSPRIVHPGIPKELGEIPFSWPKEKSFAMSCARTRVRGRKVKGIIRIMTMRSRILGAVSDARVAFPQGRNVQDAIEAEKMIYKKTERSIAIPARKIRSCDCGDANAQDQRYYTISNFFCEGQGAWRNINDVANVYDLDCDFVLNALAKIH